MSNPTAERSSSADDREVEEEFARLEPYLNGLELGCFGNYRLLRIISSGGMGTVYEAWDTTLKSPHSVALKRAKGGPSAPEVFRDRLRREGKNAKAVAHDNIVRCLVSGEENGEPYLVMDFIDGGALSDPEHLRYYRERPREVARLMARVAWAVWAIHESGIFHRDLKPGNIVLNRNRVPYVTDFGLSKDETGDLSQTVAALPLERLTTSHPNSTLAGTSPGAATFIASVSFSIFCSRESFPARALPRTSDARG